MSRLRDLVTDPISRTYLKDVGWWAEEVIEKFAFLEDAGFETPVVHFHQEGHFVRYRGPEYDVYLSYEAETGAEASLFYSNVERFRPLDDMLRSADPTYTSPPVTAGTDAETGAALAVWADALRRFLSAHE